MPARISEEVVRALLAEKNWEPVEGWEYKNASKRIPGRCLVCGQRGLGPRYNDLHQGDGACKECGIRKSAEKRRLPEGTVRALLAEKAWEPIPGWEYISGGTQIPGRCLICGWASPPDGGPRYHSLQNGEGACQRCAGRERPSEETLCTLLAEKNWEPIEGWEYANATTPIPGRCLICGYEGPGPMYSNLSRNRGACKQCGEGKHTEEAVRTLLAEKNWAPDEPFEYRNALTPIPGRCLACGYKGSGPTYGNLTQRRSNACPSCSEYGYDPAKPGWFYRFEFVFESQTFVCYGITNVVDQRRKTYERKLDVQNFQSLYFEDGSVPKKIEKEFHEIRQESSAPASTCGVVGTVTESFSLSPENWELSTVFEAHWAAAALKAQ